MNTTIPTAAASTPIVAGILLVEDDDLVARVIERMLVARGCSVRRVRNGAAGIAEALEKPYELVLTDIQMPVVSGMEMLRELRARGCDVPVILMTGHPQFESARDAVELGALQYLTKPVDHDLLLIAIERARNVRRARPGDEPQLHVDDASFARVLGSMGMAFQPIVSLESGGAVAYEALVRSDDPTYPTPGALFSFAARAGAGRERELGRTIRQLCAAAVVELPPSVSMFVNVDAGDLTDPELFLPGSPLARHAEKVVLEITERSAIDRISDLEERVRTLRGLGFRVAVDDLGAGYAGLSSIALLEPDFVKLDMSLTRDIESSPMRSRLVASMVEACRDLHIRLIAEGVETGSELRALRGLGCDLAQGYYLGRPNRRFGRLAA